MPHSILKHMKNFSIRWIAFSVFAVAIGSFASVCALGQTIDATPSVFAAHKLDCEKEVRRVPPARFYKDESGEVVYSINGNESWRRTEIQVKRGQKIEISASGVVRWAQDGI